MRRRRIWKKKNMKEEYLLCACTNLTPYAVLQLLPSVTGRMLGWEAQCVILLSPFLFLKGGLSGPTASGNLNLSPMIWITDVISPCHHAEPYLSGCCPDRKDTRLEKGVQKRWVFVLGLKLCPVSDSPIQERHWYTGVSPVKTTKTIKGSQAHAIQGEPEGTRLTS